MANLLSESEAASAWVDHTIDTLKGLATFGSFNSGVIWTDIDHPSEGRSVPVDPELLAKEIADHGIPLLLNHDPGKPIGRVLAARAFRALDGRRFVAAVFGYYAGAAQIGFSDLGFDASKALKLPEELPPIRDDFWIEIAVDPREVDEEWIIRSAEGAPLRVRKRPLSHNAADAAFELIRVTLPYAALVWNPFVTTIAKEAGKDVYAAIRNWMGRFLKHVSEHRNPILILQASLTNCDVFFILRGNDLDDLLVARDSLDAAAVQASHLVAVMNQRDTAPSELYYEFDNGRKTWLPSYALLRDGRLITDNRMLVVAEKLPQGLSLGFGGFGDD